MIQNPEEALDELWAENRKLVSLLVRAGVGFSAFINGRKMARRERDQLIYDIREAIRPYEADQ